MTIPRRASVKFLALLTFACLAAVLTPRLAAQSTAAASKPQSPNGKIAYQSTQGGDGFANDIYVMDADGKHQTRLTDTTANDDVTPVWSPDGTKVAFHNFNVAVDLYVVNADGSRRATNYTKTRRDDEFGYSWQKVQ